MPTSAFGDLDGDERRRLARLAGILLIVGSVTALPAGLLLDPAPEPYEHIVATLGAITGAVIFRLPWERLSSVWLHVLLVLGTLEVLMGVIVFSETYALFYSLVAMYAAYVVRERTALVLYLMFFETVLLAPLVFGGATREEAHVALLVTPVIFITAVVVRYLRETLELREQAYRDFAIEAVGLAERIRGTESGHDGDGGDGHDGHDGADGANLASRIERLQHGRPEDE